MQQYWCFVLWYRLQAFDTSVSIKIWQNCFLAFDCNVSKYISLATVAKQTSISAILELTAQHMLDEWNYFPGRVSDFCIDPPKSLSPELCMWQCGICVCECVCVKWIAWMCKLFKCFRVRRINRRLNDMHILFWHYVAYFAASLVQLMSLQMFIKSLLANKAHWHLAAYLKIKSIAN